ncbi:MAG: HAD hydrolase family protein [Bacteroidales bacterium]|nr:HAD hydrolase family protein [Bacteroidales bacterium]
MSNYKVKLANIKGFAFDVDGVFTDGGVIGTASGDLIRVYDSKDGFGLRMAYLKGYKTAIVTGGSSESIKKRFLGIGVKEEDIYLKSRDKVPDFLDFCKRNGLEPSEVAFVGDDLPDIPILKICGLAVCPADAVPEVKEVCDYVSQFNGGKGCVRDLIEQVLKVQGKWVFDPVAYSG